MNSVRRALEYFRPDAGRLVGVFLLMLLSIGLNVLKPWPLAIIVDSVLGHKPLPQFLARLPENKALLISTLSVAVLLLHLGHGALSAIQNFVSIKIGLRGLTRVRDEVFAKLQRLSLRFHQGTKSGDLIYRASWDTYAFQTLFQQGLVTFVTAFISLLMMLVIMAQVNLRLTLVAILLVPILVITIRVFGSKMTTRTSEAQRADSRVTSFVQQTIAAMQLIQSYTREEVEKERFGQHAGNAEEKRVSQHGSELLYWFGIAAVFGIGAAAITWFGANEVEAGRLSIGGLLVFVAYLAQLYEPLNQLSHVGATVSGATAGIRRVFEILDTPEEIKDASLPATTAHSTSAIRGAIEFSNVSFGYEKDCEVLKNISFRLGAGESLALIGPSGAGKTTLLNLIPRFFDPSQGSIRIDGIDIRNLSLHHLRSHVSFVLQQPIILPGTIAENIGFGKTGATAEAIEAAARSANAHQFIERFPKKYQTVVGDGAARLSVGEQQRINLARAFLKDAPILLLDEPTSALDADTEAMILDSLQKLMDGRTTIIVAHRLATIRKVHRVITLEDGRITESGAQIELAGKAGYYQRLTVARAI